MRARVLVRNVQRSHLVVMVRPAQPVSAASGQVVGVGEPFGSSAPTTTCVLANTTHTVPALLRRRLTEALCRTSSRTLAPSDDHAAMIAVIEDVNLGCVDAYGTCEAQELLRQLFGVSSWHERRPQGKMEAVSIERVAVVATMRTVIPATVNSGVDHGEEVAGAAGVAVHPSAGALGRLDARLGATFSVVTCVEPDMEHVFEALHAVRVLSPSSPPMCAADSLVGVVFSFSAWPRTFTRI